jgi:hypothetical protein
MEEADVRGLVAKRLSQDEDDELFDDDDERDILKALIVKKSLSSRGVGGHWDHLVAQRHHTVTDGLDHEPLTHDLYEHTYKM